MDHMDQHAAVNGIDLTRVQAKLQTEAGIERPAALAATDLYRKFLFLKVKYTGENLVPPKLADEAWHQHILQTEAYMQDCQKLFGVYLHHTADPDDTAKQAAWNRTKELFAKEFGVSLDNHTVEGVAVASNCQ